MLSMAMRMASCALTRSLEVARFVSASSVRAASSVSFRRDPSFFISSSATRSSLSSSAVHTSCPPRIPLAEALGFSIFWTTDELCGMVERSTTVSRPVSFLDPARLSLRCRESCDIMALRLEAELLRRLVSRYVPVPLDFVDFVDFSEGVGLGGLELPRLRVLWLW